MMLRRLLRPKCEHEFERVSEHGGRWKTRGGYVVACSDVGMTVTFELVHYDVEITEECRLCGYRRTRTGIPEWETVTVRFPAVKCTRCAYFTYGDPWLPYLYFDWWSKLDMECPVCHRELTYCDEELAAEMRDQNYELLRRYDDTLAKAEIESSARYLLRKVQSQLDEIRMLLLASPKSQDLLRQIWENWGNEKRA